MEIKHALEDIGLNNQEASVYLTTLKLGVAKASAIAQKTGIRRGGVYYTLKLLKQKGFISEVIKSGVTYYSAASPERILDLIEEERDQKKKTIKDILPELKGLQTTALERPQIEIYEGPEGFKTIFSKLIEKPKQHFSCYLSAHILEYMPYFHTQFRKRRSAKHISIRTITERTPQLEEIKNLDNKERRETRFNNKLFKQSEILYYILDDAIVIIKANKKEQLAIYIKEKNLAHLQKNIFEQLWKPAKQRKEKNYFSSR